MSRRVAARLGLAVLVVGVAACGPAKDSGGGSVSAVQADMRRSSQIPPRVPARFGDIGQGQGDVYAATETVRSDAYSIILGTSPDCNGGNYCRLGTIAAEKITSATPRLQGGKPIALQNGVAGLFFEYECGANCPDNTIVWEQAEVRYTVGIKAGNRDQLARLANDTMAAR